MQSSRHTLCLVLSVCAGCLLTITRVVRAQDSSTTAADVVLQVDPVAKTVHVAKPAHGRLVDSVEAGTWRVRRQATVRLQVVNTNTALYRITTEDNPAPAPPTAQPIRQFLPMMKSYLPELAFVVPRGRGPAGARRASTLPESVPEGVSLASAAVAARALATGQAVESDLLRLDQLSHGPRGVDAVLGLTLRTLDRMRIGDVEAQARAMADTLEVPDQSCQESAPGAKARGVASGALTISSDVLATLNTLQPEAAELRAALSDTLLMDISIVELRSGLQRVEARADTALRDSDAMLTGVYRVEHTANQVLGACSHWESPPVRVSPSAGRVVTVRVQPLSDPEIQRVAGDRSYSFSVTLLPPPARLNATLALSALYASRAIYHTYGVRATGGSGSPNEVYESSTVDDRFSYGVTLGITWYPWLDWRGTHNVALWLPEVTVAEAGSGPRAFALGAALSLWSVKVGFGAVMVRHAVLDGLAIGDHVPNDKFLRTRDTYGHAVRYFSISIFNLPDLLSGGHGGGDDGGRPPGPGDGGKPAKK